ncbi:hypothetical protein B2M26_03880 [Ferroacidibacillus organovorans]|uniref:Uncharacterized protein n=1 Tax=Ferroacidibacillus organovorans TaxID=1765683 RepID=A0A1V4EVI5_9BACL|nr:hypothetical protein B2M26_03880 [Ferroacidibacillus organovorans]
MERIEYKIYTKVIHVSSRRNTLVIVSKHRSESRPKRKASVKLVVDHFPYRLLLVLPRQIQRKKFFGIIDGHQYHVTYINIDGGEWQHLTARLSAISTKAIWFYKDLTVHDST